ncbi:hypothetical protein PROFUN_15758 [Planoprotostelium fungivorum]|nr:hypothetical protein PROFUN_15758 [Planoprotostelium fungivorum]
MKSSYILLSLFALVACNVLDLYTTQSGDGTYYGPDNNSGNCGIYPVPSQISSATQGLNVAMNAPQYFGSAACGLCLQVTGNGTGSGSNPITGTFLVFVNDQCPECKPGDLDLAKNGDGRWKISWKVVDCPVGDSKIQYSYQSISQYYIKLQPRNNRIALNYISIQDPTSGTYFAMTRTSDNYFTLPDSYNAKPLTFPIKIQ